MSHTARTEEEMVTVAVPRGIYPDVLDLIYRYLADDDSSAASDATSGGGQEDASDPLEAQVPHNGTWSRADIEELYRSFHDADGRAVIRLIAHRSLNGEVACETELMDQVGLDAHELSARLEAFAKAAAALKGENIWPMVDIDERGNSRPDRHYSYHMPPQVARWWLGIDHVPSVDAEGH